LDLAPLDSTYSPEIIPVAVDRIELCNAAGASLATLTPTAPILLEPADSLKLIVHLSTVIIPPESPDSSIADGPDSNLTSGPSDTAETQDTDTATSTSTDSLITSEEPSIDGPSADTTQVAAPTDPPAAESDHPGSGNITAPDSTGAPQAAFSSVVIDEILADPPAGIDGDANRDGERHTYHDEFVELFNANTQSVSLAGWKLGDDDTDPQRWFTFPADAVIPSNGRLLLFGGGTPTGFTLPVFVDDGRIGNGLTNGGDTVLLVDATGDTVDIIFGENWKSDQSQARTPDGTFAGHTSLSNPEIPFSPGRATDAVETDATPDDAPVDSTSGDQNETPPISEPDTATATDSLESLQPPLDPAPPDSTASPDSPDALADSLLSDEETILPDSLAAASPNSADSTLVDSQPLDTPPADSTNAENPVPDAAPPDSTDAPADSTAVNPLVPADSTATETSPSNGSPTDSTNSGTPADSSATVADSTDIPISSTPSVIIDEILADPPPGLAGDANRDGERHTYRDEFIELLNADTHPISLAGWKLGDDDTNLQNWFTFPTDAVIQPSGRVLLFGGGTPTGFTVPVFVDDGRIGNGLTNGGDTVLLVDATGDTVDIILGASWKSDQSQVRSLTDVFVGSIDVPLVGHIDASSQSAPFSPGQATNAVETDATPADAPVDSTSGDQNETPPVSEPDAAATPDSLESPQIPTDAEDAPLDPVPPDSTANSDSVPSTPADSTLSIEETILPDSLTAPPPPLADSTETATADSTLLDTTSADSTDISLLPDTAPADSTDAITPTPADSTLPDTVSVDSTDTLPLSPDPTSADSTNVAIPTPADSLLAPDESQADSIDATTIPSINPDDNGSISTDSTNVADTPSVIIDEILADPPPGLDGDANRDGERHTYHDEFVELLNIGTHSVSLAGWKLGDDDTDPQIWFTFPADAVIPPGERLLLFGGGTPTGFTVPVFVDDGRIGNGLTNGGDTVLLIDAAGDTVDLLYGDNWKGDQSQVRSPDGTFTGHISLSSPETPFSPGAPTTVADILPDPAPKPGTPDTLETSLPSADPIYQAKSEPAGPPISLIRASLIITEILADPPPGLAGDANGDGIADSYEDEFVELLNLGPPLDLSGWHLSDDDTRFESQFRFPPGTIINTGQYLVLFGGGIPIDIPAPAFVDDGRIGNGLTNTGDRILLIPPTLADTAIALDFVDNGSGDRSLFRTEDDRYAPHDQLPGRSPFSPGRDRPLYTHFTLDSLIITPGQPPVALPLHGHHADGQDTIAADKLLWRSFDEEILQFDTDGRALPLRLGDANVIAGIPGHILARSLVRVRSPEPPPNEPPHITSIPDTTIYAGSPYRYQIRALDPENNSLVYALLQSPSWLDLGSLTGLLSGRAPPGEIGSTEVSFQVADGRGGLDTQHYLLHILPRPAIRISEVFADPPPGPAGDANGDGVRQTYADEFVELYNYGNRPVDLSGWRLGDDDADDGDQFHFPIATLLPPGTRTVLFGGGLPRGDRFFADDGRIGNGLDNRTEQIYLIDPQGPDTLARAFYDLDRAPDQALVWDSDSAPPLLHTRWPGRDFFSPGRPRPLLQSLQLIPRALSLLVGEKATPRLIGHYSDGERYDLLQSPLWSSTHPRIATVNLQGEVTAIDTGESTVTARLDTFAVSARIDIRLPLATRLRFTPAWEQIFLPPGRQLLFAVHPTGTEALSYHWSLNGRSQVTTALQLSHKTSSLSADTVTVQIHSQRETTTRQWIISANRPPQVGPQIDTLAILGQVFSLDIRASDPDDDVLLYLPERMPAGAHLHPMSGKLTWTPSATGRFHCRIQISDGYHLLPWQCDLRVLPPPAKPSSPPLRLSPSSHPNPFSSAVTITFRPSTERPLPATVLIYGITGQLLRTLIATPLSSGQHTVRWDGTDRRGHPVAAGIYLYRVECGNQRTGGKLLFLP